MIVRCPEDTYQHQLLLEQAENLNAVYDSLNYLGAFPWTVNGPVRVHSVAYIILLCLCLLHHCSHCNAWSCVTLFITSFCHHAYVLCRYIYYAILLSLCVQRQGEHNKLLAQVAKRAKRAQLLVYMKTIRRKIRMIVKCTEGPVSNLTWCRH